MKGTSFFHYRKPHPELLASNELYKRLAALLLFGMTDINQFRSQSITYTLRPRLSFTALKFIARHLKLGYQHVEFDLERS